jgi:hypothetical protein
VCLLIPLKLLKKQVLSLEWCFVWCLQASLLALQCCFDMVFTTSRAYPWSFVSHICHIGQPSHGGDRKTFASMSST